MPRHEPEVISAACQSLFERAPGGTRLFTGIIADYRNFIRQSGISPHEANDIMFGFTMGVAMSLGNIAKQGADPATLGEAIAITERFMAQVSAAEASCSENEQVDAYAMAIANLDLMLAVIAQADKPEEAREH